MMKNSNWLIKALFFALLISALSIPFLIKDCSNKKEFVKEAVEPGTDFQSIIDSKDRELAIQVVKLVENQETINTLLGENTKLKNAKAVIKYEQVIKYRDRDVPFAVKDTLADTNKITVPKTFKQSDKWLTVAGRVTKKGVVFDSIENVISGKIGIGYKKPQKFKEIFKPELSAEIQSDNPNARVQKMETFMLDKKLKWYQKPTTWLGVGFCTGVAATIVVLTQ